LALRVPFVNASRVRRALSALILCGVWQVSACGRSKREIYADDVAGASATSNAAGSGGTGGTNGSGSAGDCPLAVTFELTLADGVVPDQFCAECGVPSMTIADATGNELSLSGPNCSALCSTCEIPTCHSIIRCGTQVLMTAAERTWSGEYYDALTCGPDATACLAANCAAPGHYSVSFCMSTGHEILNDANAIDECVADTSASMFCQIVAFDLPASAPISVVLDPSN
jgi:hypothetical protein